MIIKFVIVHFGIWITKLNSSETQFCTIFELFIFINKKPTWKNGGQWSPGWTFFVDRSYGSCPKTCVTYDIIHKSNNHLSSFTENSEVLEYSMMNLRIKYSTDNERIFFDRFHGSATNNPADLVCNSTRSAWVFR